MKELIQAAAEQLNVLADSCVLPEDGGKILDIELIDNGQKLYLVSERTNYEQLHCCTVL